MAKVTVPAYPSRDIQNETDWLLDLALQTWRDLPRIAHEIDGWEPIDQVIFCEEWPLEEMRLARLEKMNAEAEFTAKQQAKFSELMALVRQNRAIVDKILAD
jgi:hypothetical protein